MVYGIYNELVTGANLLTNIHITGGLTLYVYRYGYGHGHMISASNSPKKNPGWFLCDSQALCDKLIRINTYNDLVHAAGQHPNFQESKLGFFCIIPW